MERCSGFDNRGVYSCLMSDTAESVTAQQRQSQTGRIRKWQRRSGLRDVRLTADSTLKQMVRGCQARLGHTRACTLQHSIIFGLAGKHFNGQLFSFASFFFLTVEELHMLEVLPSAPQLFSRSVYWSFNSHCRTHDPFCLFV